MSDESKFLSCILRDQPDIIGLTLGRGGWVRLDELLRGMKKTRHRITSDATRQIVAQDDEQQFTLSEDGQRDRRSPIWTGGCRLH